MMTPSEYLKQGPKVLDEPLWLHGMDVIKHCLQKDIEQTFYKDKRPAHSHWDEWNEALSDRAQTQDNFEEIYENAFAPKQNIDRVQCDHGNFNLGYYMQGEKQVFRDEIVVNTQKDAVTVLLDMAVPYKNRDKHYMVERHQKIYDLIAQCDSENRPLQVLGVKCNRIDETRKPIIMFFTVKDYHDNIFPTIWGTLKNNLVTNSFANVIMDYFIGTKSGGNGTPTKIRKIEQYFPECEELHIFGTYPLSDNATIYN